jgi:glycosyltransferase involved in cell wall biosynthesis
MAHGHEAVMLVPALRAPGLDPRSLARWKAYAYDRWFGRIADGVASYGLSNRVLRFDPDRLEDVPSADAVVATAWRTAEWTAAMPERAGRKYYLIQQYERWEPGMEARVDATWSLPLRRIVIAKWLERLARERFGVDVCARIPNGVDTARFTPATARQPGPLRLGMLYDLSPWKGCEDGVAALWMIHRTEPRAEFVLFGRNRLRHTLPPRTRYHRNPRQAELPGLYRASDVFLNSSHSEGFSLVTLEAMASGCALVATAVGELAEMGRPGTDFLAVAPHDPEALAGAAMELVRDDARRRAVALAGLELAREYTWERATRQLERALEDGRS